MQLILALFILICWFFLFGLECSINGLICDKWWKVPFVGLKQDLDWMLFNTIEDGPGVVHYITMHGIGLVLPIYMIIDFMKDKL